jgi:hypothetical protein
MQDSVAIGFSGNISQLPQTTITVDVNTVIGQNQMSTGFQLDQLSWLGFINYADRKQLAQDAGFKLVRVFDFRKTNPRLMPCTYFNEQDYSSSTWDWTNVDSLVNAIFSVGAEPMFCLSYIRENIQNYIPPGMTVNSQTGLPNPESYAYYASMWVNHFKETGKPVRFYQIGNEPATYFGYTPVNTQKLGFYVELWNSAAKAMRTINPNIIISQDCITRKGVLEYWIQHGEDIDALDFHKYDCFSIPSEYDDETLLGRTETRYFETGSTAWGVEDARQMWHDSRGKWLIVINSESNMNANCDAGTDPRLQQMFGAVWTGLVLRTAILKGLSYNVYYEFCSSKSYGQGTATGGYGFGMVNSDNQQPWYPYYVHYLIGSNLHVGDPLIRVISNSEDIRTLAWLRDQTLNILVISKVEDVKTINLVGVQDQLHISKIDNTISWQTPQIQNEISNINEPLTLNGYTVALIQTSV